MPHDRVPLLCSRCGRSIDGEPVTLEEERKTGRLFAFGQLDELWAGRVLYYCGTPCAAAAMAKPPGGGRGESSWHRDLDA